MGRIPRLGFMALIVILNIATGGDYPYPVTGVIGGNTELAIQQNFSGIKEIVWKFIRGSRTFKIAEFKNNKLETGDPQFQNRLEIFRDGKGLRIKNAILDDSGTYIAKITLVNHTLYKELFNVSLYEPVPVPSIRIDDENGNTCNVTLYCDVPANTTSVSYTWKYKNGSDYQLYKSTGSKIQMPLQPEPLEVLCIVHNPADWKNVSVTLKPCHQKVTETPQNRLRSSLLFLLLVVLLSSAAYIIHYIKEKMKSRAASQTSCKEEAVKFGVPEKDNPIALSEICVDTNPIQEDVPFPISKHAIKYSEYFFSVHELKQDDKMTFDDGELPSTLPLQEDSEKT